MKEINLTYINLQDLKCDFPQITQINTCCSGATIALPMAHYPNSFVGFGETSRDLNRNNFLGITLAVPEINAISFGFGYKDFNYGDEFAYDEDIYVLYSRKKLMIKYKKQEFERKYPIFFNTHHSSKCYLENTEREMVV